MPKLLENTNLTSIKTLNFSVSDSAWYVIEISAKVKSKKQRRENETDDEELLVKIDNQTFPKIGSKQSLFNSPASFSGGTMHDVEKTIYFILNLAKSEHIITLQPQHSAKVIKVSYDTIDTSNNEFLLTFNKQASDRDRKPWITFVLIENEITSFTTKVQLQWRWFDGDDIQVVIDNEIQKNPRSLLHKNWIFSARPIIDLFGRVQSKVFQIPQNTNTIHYIELLADKMPTLESINLNFKETKPLTLKHYNLGPQGEDYNRFNTEINDQVTYWNNEFSKQQFPPSTPLDPNLVKAIMYVESEMGYGDDPTGQPAFPDVMQIGDENNPAIHTLNNDGWIDPITKIVARENVWDIDGSVTMDYKGEAQINTVSDSIYWAVRWLYHKAEIILNNGNRQWRTWKDTLLLYNGGGDPDYKEKVNNAYKKGMGRNRFKLWSLILLLLLPVCLSVFALIYYQGKFFVYAQEIPESKVMYSNDYKFVIKVLDGFQIKSFEFAKYYGNGLDSQVFDKESTLELENIEMPKSCKCQLLSVSGENMPSYKVVALIKYSNGSFEVLKNNSEIRGKKKTFFGNNVVIKNTDTDPEPEVVEESFIPYSNAPDEWWLSYYDFDNKSGEYFLKSTEKIPTT